MKEKQFSGRVAYVTGASSGIGAATAELLAQRGAEVACVARDRVRGQMTVERIRAAGGSAEYIPADMEKADEIAWSVAETLRRFGRLDLAFNNAGMTGAAAPMHEQDDAEWARVLATNLTSVFLCMKHQLAHMRSAGGGVIVNNSSGAGVMPAPGLPHYTAAKHGVLGLTKCAAREYAPDGIRVNAVCPGLIWTPQLEAHLADEKARTAMLSQIPSGVVGQPEDVARAVAFLFSDDAAYVSGDTMFIDAAFICR